MSCSTREHLPKTNIRADFVDMFVLQRESNKCQQPVQLRDPTSIVLSLFTVCYTDDGLI